MDNITILFVFLGVVGLGFFWLQNIVGFNPKKTPLSSFSCVLTPLLIKHIFIVKMGFYALPIIAPPLLREGYREVTGYYAFQLKKQEFEKKLLDNPKKTLQKSTKKQIKNYLKVNNTAAKSLHDLGEEIKRDDMQKKELRKKVYNLQLWGGGAICTLTILFILKWKKII